MCFPGRSRLPRWARRIVFAALVAVYGIGVASAQEAPVFTFAWRGVPLEDALRELQSASSINIAWLPILAEGKKVYCVARAQPLEAVLTCVLDGSGLDYYKRSSGTYVIEPSRESPPLWGSMRGIIVDASTRQPVSSAHIYLAEARRGRVANASGMFAFDQLLPGSYAVQVSHIGYRTTRQTVVIEPGGSARPEIPLVSQPILLSPIIFEGLASQSSSTLLGSAIMEQEELGGSGPLTGGPVQGLNAMMGVRVTDATADIHIQGGDAGEHQFRLDGAPVFVPLNVASFIGPFSPFSLGTIRVNKAGFGASLGSQISGVIDASHDLRYAGADQLDGGLRYVDQTLVQIDPLSLNARHSGFASTRTGLRVSFMGTTRIGLWGISAPDPLSNLMDSWNRIDSFLLSAFADRNTPFADFPPVGSPGIGFADVNLAAELKKGLSTVNTSVFVGGSRLGNDIAGSSVDDPLGAASGISEYRDIYYWQNATAQVRYNTVLNARSLGSLQARFSRYRLRHDFVARDEITLESPEDDGNQIVEAALSGTLDYTLGERNYTESGLELVVTGDRFRIAGSQQLPLNHRFVGFRAAGYAQDRVQLGDHAALEVGTRFTYLHARRSLYAEPRLSLRLDFPGTRTGTWAFFVGSGIYRQFVNQFDISSRSPRTFVSSTRFWMAVDSTVAPAKSGHLAAEVLWRPTRKWTINAEALYKRHYHILALDYSAATDREDLAQRDFLRSSKGYTVGYAAVIRRSVGLGSAQARYEYTLGRRQITGLFENRLLDVPWGEPHRFELALDMMPVRNLVFVGRWRLIQGRTWGFRQAYYDFMGAYLNDIDRVLDSVINPSARARIERQALFYRLTDPESHRLPVLSQLDLGVGYSVMTGPVSVQARLDVANILGRTNVADWRFVFDEDSYFGQGPNPSDSGILDRGIRALLPRVTTLTVSLRW